MTDDNRDKFSYVAGRYGQIIKFYNVEKICADEINYINQLFEKEHTSESFSMGKFYRLLASQIFSEIEKVIYLDSDIIVNLDINELWKISLGDKPIAAVPEFEMGSNLMDYMLSCQEGIVDFKNYFNSGVLVINLQKIRQSEIENIKEKIIFRAQNPQYSYYDQEILNYCFSKNYLKLPNKFNVFTFISRNIKNFCTENRIIHYAARSVQTDMSDNFNKLWFSYFEKTPWFNKDIIVHIDEEIKKIVHQVGVQFQNLALQVSALISGKSRVFVTIGQNIDAKKNFLT